MRDSLLVRVLASSVLVAVCSVTATAWLAVQGTTGAITQEQGETLAIDTEIHDTLLGYAATHPDWSGVGATLRDLADETGRRVSLTTENRQVIADSAADRPPLPPRASSVVDPLAVDVTLVSEDAGRIDPRATGPFTLDSDERDRLRGIADDVAACLNAQGFEAEVATEPGGRPEVRNIADVPVEWSASCGMDELDAPTEGERQALDELNELINTCLARADRSPVTYRLDGTWTSAEPAPARPGSKTVPAAEAAPSPPMAPDPEPPAPDPPGDEPAAPSADPGEAVPEPAEDPVPPPGDPAPPGGGMEPAATPMPSPASGPSMAPTAPETDPVEAACVDSGRREQLEPYVAPAALLFIDDPEAGADGPLSLSGAGLTRIVGVVAAVLLLTVLVSVTVSTRLIRPVQALTREVRRMRAGEGAARVPVRDDGELGRLAAAFNEMSEHLERMEEQRKAMVSDVSHELRTPLSNIRGWLEAGQDGVATLDTERMAMLIEETLLLQRIIDDLQDIALADAGKLRLSPGHVDVRELLEQAVASHRLHAEAAEVELLLDVRDDIRLVADRERLLQVVGNLLGNALRHTPGPGRVTVRASRDDGAALIEVADTGSGIAAEDLPHVFSRFWRAEKSRDRRTGGSGLGLTIVRNIVELHGGTVSVASTLGEGSTFALRLPLRAGDPGAG
ncbi:sensor histidine kinase [Marinitenerispora sediminis]|uniref:sensor histidine kinase n=1 Tax=Marinitenerispora sediminis TaxID=1931232 RepID=UPI001F368EF3|nr:ATP-binding protein [Marinitenerispora sediminis]